MPGLIRGVARTAVVAGTATAVSNRVSRRQGDRWAQQDYQATQAAPPPPPQQAPPPAAAPAAPAPSVPEQLEQLADLRDRGVLSPEEFEAQKAKILGT